MTSIEEQVTHLRQQIEALTEQVTLLAGRRENELPAEKQTSAESKEVGINRFRNLHGNA